MAGLDFNFFDAYGLTGDNDPLDVQEASHRLNARLGVTNGQLDSNDLWQKHNK